MDMQSPGIFGMEAFYEVVFVDAPHIGSATQPDELSLAEQASLGNLSAVFPNNP